MKFFLVKIEWSQTDQEETVVMADSKHNAEVMVKSQTNARYVTAREVKMAQSLQEIIKDGIEYRNFGETL